ncbi:MAG: efflux RND transporter periplasmic adaptor subunit [Gemmataceae bacterium]
MKSNRVFTAAAVAAGAAAAVWVLFVADRRLVADPPTAPTPDPTPVAYPRPAMAFGIGYVEPANEARAGHPRAGGVVRTVHVNPGDRVAAGALLVELDDATWQAELAQAKADRALSVAEQTEVEVGVHESRIKAAQRAVDRAAERLRHAAAESDRLRGVKGQGVSQQELDTAATARKQAELDLQSQEAELAYLKSYVTPERRAVMAAKVAAADARIQAAEERVRATKVLAPFAGTVLRVLKREGEGVRNTDPEPVVLFADVSALRIRAEIDEHHSGRVAVGQAVVLGGRNLHGKTFRGRLVRAEPAMGTKTLFVRSAAERKDLDVREVLIEPEAGFAAPVGLKVEVEVQLEAGG